MKKVNNSLTFITLTKFNSNGFKTSDCFVKVETTKKVKFINFKLLDIDCLAN